MSTQEQAATPREAAAIYAGPSGRDRRIDILRGAALVLFALSVVANVSQPGSAAFGSTATVSALALIIALEGALVGMLHRPRLITGLGESTVRLWRRARSWYLVALVVVVGVVLVGLVPGVDTHAVTALEVGRQPFLFGAPPANAATLAISYPLDPAVLLNLVLLRVGPWPLDVAVLVSALFFVAPVCLLALARGRWLPLLAVSVALYLVELFTSVRLLPTRAEASLPLLGWQLVFVLGTVAGYYRRELVQWFRRGVGLALFLALSCAAVVWLVLPAALSVHNMGVTVDLLATLAGPQSGWLFEPSAPGPLRVVLPTAMMIVAYGALTVFWKPLNIAFGWLLVPLGSAVLPALVLLVGAAVTISSLNATRTLWFLPLAIGGLVTLAMWLLALLWQFAQARKDDI